MTPAERSMWTPEQIVPLCESIQHWLENWQDPLTAQSGSAFCACCNAVMEPGESYPDCNRCPIGTVAGSENCEYTPWANAALAIERAKMGNPYSLEAIEREYVFLIEVLMIEKEGPK